MILKISSLLVFFHLMAFTPVAVQWDQKYVKNNITVFSKAVSGSNYVASRAEMVVNAELSNLVDLINNVDAYPQLIHNCKNAKLIKKESENYITYLTFDAPWPLSDRDVYVRIKVTKTADNTVELDLSDIKEYESAKGYVRIKNLDGKWLLDPLGDSQVKVVFEVHMNPGGNVPAFVVNNSADDQVYYTLLNVRERIK